MTTVSQKLTGIVVQAYFPPPMQVEEQIINDGTGVVTFNDLSGQVHYYLRIDGGKIVNKPRLGELVTASGKDQDNRLVAVGPMECVDDGNITRFRGPVATQT